MARLGSSLVQKWSDNLPSQWKRPRCESPGIPRPTPSISHHNFAKRDHWPRSWAGLTNPATACLERGPLPRLQGQPADRFERPWMRSRSDDWRNPARSGIYGPISRRHKWAGCLDIGALSYRGAPAVRSEASALAATPSSRRIGGNEAIIAEMSMRSAQTEGEIADRRFHVPLRAPPATPRYRRW